MEIVIIWQINVHCVLHQYVPTAITHIRNKATDTMPDLLHLYPLNSVIPALKLLTGNKYIKLNKQTNVFLSTDAPF